MSLSNYLKYIAYLGIAALIFNIVVILIYNKKINVNHPLMTWDEGSSPIDDQPRFDPQTGERIEPQQTQRFDPQTGQPIQSQGIDFKGTLDKFKAFIKTKNGKITLGVVGAVIVAFIGYNIYNTYFNKTSINLTDKMEVTFSGDNGEGEMSVKSNDIDYDKNDYDIKSFVNSISYDYENNGKLSNGDKVKVSVIYSKTNAEGLKLSISSDTKEVTVSGLTERYSKASKVPGKLLKLAKTYLDEKAEKYYKSSSYTTYTYSLENVYFGKATSDYDRDIIIGVYKVTSTYKGFGGDETKTYYDSIYLSGIDSTFTEKYAKASPYGYSNSLYAPDSYDRLTDANQLQDVLKDEYDDYTITEFK